VCEEKTVEIIGREMYNHRNRCMNAEYSTNGVDLLQLLAQCLVAVHQSVVLLTESM